MLTALDVINAIDPLERIDSCPVQIDSHTSELCPMHRCVDEAMAQIEETFRQTTIGDVISSVPDSQTFCEAFGRCRPKPAASISKEGDGR